ncbi:MAG: class I SAM-dependent methyltransferase [Phycisphaerae bacterium]
MTEPHQPEIRLQPVPCDYCGSEEAEPCFSGPDRVCGLEGEFHVVRCRECGLLRTNPQPVPEDLPKAYLPSYDVHEASVRIPEPPGGLLRWALVNYRAYPLGSKAPAVVRLAMGPWAVLRLRGRKFIDYVPYRGEGRLLDFGCGTGRYVARMAAAGWHAEGIDLVPQAVAAGRQAGLTIHEGTLPGGALPASHYDVITMWHVLEHVPGPMATLKAARDLLRPDGRLVVVCPMVDSLAASWFGASWFGMRELPRHLTHFSQKTLRRHLEAAGFDVVRVVPIRRPTFMRHSLLQEAEDTGKARYRWLARSRMLSRVLSHLARLLGRTDEVLFEARRCEPESPGGG